MGGRSCALQRQLSGLAAQFLNGDRGDFCAALFDFMPGTTSNQRLYEATGNFTGIVTALRHGHLFAKEQQSQQEVFISRANVAVDSWSQLTEGCRVSFRLAFNFRGPVGFDCLIHSQLL